MLIKYKHTYRLNLQIFSLMLIAVLAFSFTACSQQSSWQEQYDLGVRYLSDGNYEEAIIAFTAAIEIEPKLAEAYIGLADTYLAMGEEALAYDVIIDGINACEDEPQIFDDYITKNFDGQSFIINAELTQLLRKGILSIDDLPNAVDYFGGYRGIVIGDTMETVLEKLGFGAGHNFPSVDIYVDNDPRTSEFCYWKESVRIGHSSGNEVVPNIYLAFWDEEGNYKDGFDYFFDDQVHLTEINYLYEDNDIQIEVDEFSDGGHIIINKYYFNSSEGRMVKEEEYRDGELIISNEYD